ncbi:MFS transporter [Parathalassolituus penaei]|uniref:MFS transporter n=1 Tax=Parathalassolituus penaei TaxID=2997323 RepID=A0A9X3ITC2_9GAMM|nr:MFS transporter [Parathalassolituus penaei]MCY0965754.1 MFS transporter [Parathalassolituus penaei]
MNSPSQTLPVSVQQGNIWRLAIAQALAGANAIVIFATAAILGSMLAPLPVLATLPVTIFVVGMAACIWPMGVLARYYGRKAAFMAGTLCGTLAGLIAVLAVMQTSFWLLCLSTFLGGAYAAVVLSFRFAAADGVAPERKARALSLVMAGGVAAGVIGPQLVTFTMNLWPGHTFAGTFLIQALVAMLSALVLAGVQLPATPAPVAGQTAAGRPLSEVIRQPLFITAVICGAVAYTVMNFVMTAAPLAMHFCGYPQSSSNLGIQWHVIAMYAPSFFTGRLIERWGAMPVSMAGLLLTLGSIGVGLMGIEIMHFWAMLVLLGVGWNFGFLGASALVLQCHSAEEKNRVQSLNDFIIFGLMAIGSLSSGGVLTAWGWNAVLWASLAPLLLAVLVLLRVRKG